MKALFSLLLTITITITCMAQVYWPNDLDYFKTELPKKHKYLFFKLTEKEFNARIDTLNFKELTNAIIVGEETAGTTGEKR